MRKDIARRLKRLEANHPAIVNRRMTTLELFRERLSFIQGRCNLEYVSLLSIHHGWMVSDWIASNTTDEFQLTDVALRVLDSNGLSEYLLGKELDARLRSGDLQVDSKGKELDERRAPILFELAWGEMSGNLMDWLNFCVPGNCKFLGCKCNVRDPWKMRPVSKTLPVGIEAI